MADTRLDWPEGTPHKLATYAVSSPFAPILGSPDINARQLMELVYGQSFDVHKVQGDFVFGRVCPLITGSARKAYVGWTHKTMLTTPETSEPTHYVTALSAPLFSDADLKSPIKMSVPLGSRLRVDGEQGDYWSVGGGGVWVHKNHAASCSVVMTSLVAAARLYLGQPYIWGGNGARGVDCSGLIQMACAAIGVDAPRDADLQEAELGSPIARPEQAGDLLFWAGHVGVLGSAETLIHANAHHMSCVEEPLGEALERMAGNGLPLRSVRRLPI